MSLEQKVIRRYNEGPYLLFDSSSIQYGVIPTALSEISKDVDWSISFFLIADTLVNGAYLVSCRNNGAEGWAIRVNNSTIEFQVNTSSEVRYVYSLENNLNKVGHYVFNYSSSNRALNLYKDGVFRETKTLANDEFINLGTETYVGAYNTVSSNVRYNGGVIGLATHNRVLTLNEIENSYDIGIPSQSSHTSIEHYFPLNDRAYENGGSFYLRDVASIYNPSAITTDVELFGWTDAELGVTDHTTATAYRDWHTKVQTTISQGYNKGLNFDASKRQYLEVTGLEQFDNSEGYTVLIGWERDNDTPPTDAETLISNIRGVSNYADYMGIQFVSNERRMGFYRTITGNNENTLGLKFDVPNLSAFTFGEDREIVDAYSSVKDTARYYRNGNITGNNKGTYPNHYGFDETLGLFHVGCLDPTGSIKRFYTGKISYTVIVKGKLTQEEVKRCFNNGFYRSPYEVLPTWLHDKIILDVNYRNPFVDGSDIKFPDNSGNCQVVSNQLTSSDWGTLAGVQNSID